MNALLECVEVLLRTHGAGRTCSVQSLIALTVDRVLSICRLNKSVACVHSNSPISSRFKLFGLFLLRLLNPNGLTHVAGGDVEYDSSSRFLFGVNHASCDL